MSIAPSLGNNAYEFLVNGKNVMWFPSIESRGIQNEANLQRQPDLAPWANRLDHEGFYANGKHYTLNPSIEQLSP